MAAAQLAKEKGNVAFKAMDYNAAREQYTQAMEMDACNYAYPLNRSLANIKLGRWSEAEHDATIALSLSPGNVKAYFRRSTARRERQDFLGAQEDIQGYANAGGDAKSVAEETAKIVTARSKSSAQLVAEKEANLHKRKEADLREKLSPPGFVVAESTGKGIGVLSTQIFRRGDLILAERPLYISDDADGGTSSQASIMAAFKRLSESQQKEFLTLHNAFAGSARFNPIVGTHQTNSFAAYDDGRDKAVLCVRASRFNHSCIPNARYSWHAASGRLRIYALREIVVGEEIFVCYISARNVYGSPRKARQERLKTYGFTCACSACSLPDREQTVSDKRRLDIANIWESVPYYSPSQTADRLRSIVRAVRLMEEEKYAADADDFTNDAAGICACHSDWASVDYWAKKTYEIRVAEFGRDSQRAAEVETLHLDLRKHPLANSQRKQAFSTRL